MGLGGLGAPVMVTRTPPLVEPRVGSTALKAGLE